MAKAFLSMVTGKLESMAGEKVGQEFQLLVGVQTEAEKLKNTLQLIEAVLQDAEVKQVHQKGVKVWSQNLKHILYDAEDVLDDWFTGVAISRSALTYGTGNGIIDKVFSYLTSHFSCIQPVFLCLFGDNFQSIDVHYDIAHRIKDIQDRLDALIHDRDRLNLIANQTEEDNRHFQRPTTSMVDLSEICGRDFDKSIIVSRLQGESSKQEYWVHVPVISITGMGGLGKTTLAQIIYNEDTIKFTFKLRMWVCVSKPFDLQRVAKEIIEQAGGNPNIQDVGSESLHQRLRGCVKDKRFLLVLDDVWSEDPNDLIPIKLSLDTGERGSKIIITTRNEQVANMMGSTYTHKLGQLSDVDSCSLFRKIAFSGRSREELQSFEEIAKGIARKCKGVPLAVKTIASLMRLKRTKQGWRNVLVNGIWDVQLVEKSMLPALLLSYYALPSYLKQCFTYCSIFPKDSRIVKNNLVHVWMAQGYLGLDEEKELEMIGVQYFEDLAMRSFFQDFEVDDKGGILACKMHDLVHDLAHFLTETECLVLESNEIILPSNHIRHIYAYEGESPRILEARNIRSLMIRLQKPAFAELCSQFKYLRVLSLHDAYLKGVPDEVGRLLHLRYLDLSWNYWLEELPETLCNLTNLQTLKLDGCGLLRELPEEIGELSKLRHLEILDTKRLSNFPQSIGKLSRLRTLSKFIVSTESGGCTLRELRSLNHLAGILGLFGLGEVQNVEQANQAELKKKINLSGFELYFTDEGGGNNDDAKRMEGVLKSLQPSANLEGLLIRDYPGFTFPFWMSRKLLLSNVVKLTLQGCGNCVQVPALGNLESLEYLEIRDFWAVRHIGHELYGAGVETSFPKLKTLTLARMRQWEVWEIPFSYYKKVMPLLLTLYIWDCPKLIGLPALGRLESLEILELKMLFAVKAVGAEFLGIPSKESKMISGCGRVYEHKQEDSVFPRLKKLTFHTMPEWEEWDLPIMSFHQNVPKIEIMSHLSVLRIEGCRKLKAVPTGLGRLQGLQFLGLCRLYSMRHLGADLFGTSGGSAVLAAENGESTSSPDAVLFPRLTKLTVDNIPEWENDEDKGILNKISSSRVATAASIMRGLKRLHIGELDKLKVIPHHMLSHSLRRLLIYNCPALKGSQACLPPLLKHLELERDTGILSKSLIPIIAKDNTYPNLRSLQIHHSQHSSLPKGLSKFTSLQRLVIGRCKYLDLKPEEELRHFPMLEELKIYGSTILSERCIRDDWRNNLSHQISYSIIIDGSVITGTNGR